MSEFDPNQIPDFTLGLDTADETTHYCLLDRDGHVLGRGRAATDKKSLRELLDMEPARVVLEVSTHARWIGLLVQEAGHELLLANPRQVALIHSAARKNDVRDAERLARLGRFDARLLRPVRFRSEAARRGLVILRVRDMLVRQRTQAINGVRSIVKTDGLQPPSCDAAQFARKIVVELPEDLRMLVQPLIETIAGLDERIKTLDKLIDELCDEVFTETKRLRQVTGVGPIGALAFALTIDDPHRFQSSRDVPAYLGIVPGQDQTGHADRPMRITKAGDRFVRRLLVQSAQYILGKHGPDTDLKRWGLAMAERKGGRIGKRKAVIAVARKLAVLLHRLWLDDTPYQPLRNTA